jgi:hypothetical protein
MQQTIVVKRGSAWLKRFEGIVLHSDRDREVHLTASGGGGYVGPQGGYVAPPRITSTTTEQQTIFARSADGVEQQFEWGQWTLPVRPGSRIAVLWGARTGVSTGPYIGAINLDTAEERWAFDKWFQGQRLVTVRLRGWLCVFLSFFLACALVFGYVYRQLSERPRPEQRALVEAKMFLADVQQENRGYQADRNYMGRFQQPNAPGSPRRLAQAQQRVDEANHALRSVSGTPYDSRPSVDEVVYAMKNDGAIQAGFWVSWAVLFVAALVVAAIGAASSEARGGDDRRTEEQLRRFLRTGTLDS